MQERRRKKVVMNVAVVIALMLGLVVYEIQVYDVGFQNRIQLFFALFFGFLIYAYTITSMVIGPYFVIVTLEENNAKAAYTMAAILTLLIICINALFWGIITQANFLIITGVIVGIISIIVIVAAFSPSSK